MIALMDSAHQCTDKKEEIQDLKHPAPYRLIYQGTTLGEVKEMGVPHFLLY